MQADSATEAGSSSERSSRSMHCVLADVRRHSSTRIALSSIRRPRTPQPATARRPPASAGARLRHRQRPACRRAVPDPQAPRRGSARRPPQKLPGAPPSQPGTVGCTATKRSHRHCQCIVRTAQTPAQQPVLAQWAPHSPTELYQGGGNSGAAAAALHKVSAGPQPHDSPPGTAEPATPAAQLAAASGNHATGSADVTKKSRSGFKMTP